jgi:hypothetical protein
MTTRFDKTKEDNNSIVLGYEGDSYPENYTVPSCGLEDLDFAVFNLFNEQMPLYYVLHGEQKKIPVIFATGERFAILRRNKPLTDKSGALVLPLISITRTGLENVPQKGMTNNQMFPEVMVRRISKNNTEWRQKNNFEGFESIRHMHKSNATSFNLKPQVENNIYETIEIPPVKYFGATYEISIWSSFTQEMNDILTTVMSAYTINPGQQFRLESKKGYWFPAFVESSFNQDTNYSDFTDAERYVKYNMTLNTTGYILAPNIHNGKVGLKSMMSAPNISFETMISNVDVSPQIGGIPTNDPTSRIFDDLKNEDDTNISQRIASNPVESLQSLYDYDQSGAYITGDSDLRPYDYLGEKSSEETKTKKVAITDKNGNLIDVRASVSSNGEIVYDQKYAEKIFNISNSNK